MVVIVLVIAAAGVVVSSSGESVTFVDGCFADSSDSLTKYYLVLLMCT